ncbi:ribokinase [Caproicibacter sp. BJN0012]|uniref:ribokinase n=1 Tax=Caproicibacter sp. BJN0012 TaxID=3110227 RepID=UPI002E0F19B7
MGLKKPKILVVGSFMMDLIASAPRVPGMGETVIGTSFRTAPGGKGANQAVQCARLGASVTMAGCVGGDAFGREMTDAAKKSGVDVSHVKISGEHSSGVGNIQLETSEHGARNRILVVPGANFDLTPDDLKWMKDEIGQFDLLMLQLELTMPVVKYAAACAHAAGVPVMLNPAPAAPLDAELLECVTYLSPNEHEAALLTGLPLRADGGAVNREDLKKVTDALRAKGVDRVIVTLGGNGSAIAGAEGIRYTPCVSMPDVKDPTAAGDSFVAAFCTGITAGLPEREALAFASHAAAVTVSRMGAMPSLPTAAEVQALLRERGYAGFDPAEWNVFL